MESKDLKGVIAAIATPFDENGKVDEREDEEQERSKKKGVLQNMIDQITKKIFEHPRSIVRRKGDGR